MKLLGREAPDLSRHPEHSSESPLSVHSMTVAYNQKPVLWDMEYEAPSGSLVAIVGPNGAGKSTFLKACLDLVPRATGVVEYWGRPFHEIRERVGYVPQRESVDWDFPISVLEVVTMGLYREIGWFQSVKEKHREEARHCLEKVGMLEFESRHINQLSGGQQQRVFLARALAQKADLYFMDEPFAGVDAATEKSIVKVLEALRSEKKTVICVHHNIPTVPEYFDHVLLLNTRLVASGLVTEVFTEENVKRTYGGRLTLLDEVGESLARLSRGDK